jgi:hypothetical protein
MLETLWSAVSRTGDRITFESRPQHSASLPPEVYQLVSQQLMARPKPPLPMKLDPAASKRLMLYIHRVKNGLPVQPPVQQLPPQVRPHPLMPHMQVVPQQAAAAAPAAAPAVQQRLPMQQAPAIPSPPMQLQQRCAERVEERSANITLPGKPRPAAAAAAGLRPAAARPMPATQARPAAPAPAAARPAPAAAPPAVAAPRPAAPVAAPRPAAAGPPPAIDMALLFPQFNVPRAGQGHPAAAAAAAAAAGIPQRPAMPAAQAPAAAHMRPGAAAAPPARPVPQAAPAAAPAPAALPAPVAAAPVAPPAAPAAASDKPKLMCTICGNNKPDYLSVTCRHVGPCLDCLPDISQAEQVYPNCRTCNKPATNLLRLRM